MESSMGEVLWSIAPMQGYLRTPLCGYPPRLTIWRRFRRQGSWSALKKASSSISSERRRRISRARRVYEWSTVKNQESTMAQSIQSLYASVLPFKLNVGDRIPELLLQRNPSNLKFFLTVGDWTTKVSCRLLSALGAGDDDSAVRSGWRT
jgi:hypothetical protein